MKAYIYGSLIAAGLAIGIFGSVMLLGFGFASSTSNGTVTANVAVGNVIYLAISPNSIVISGLAPNSTYPTNIPVTDTDNGGNIGANALVEGTNWVNATTTYTFGVGNTLESNTASAPLSGIPLTSSFAVTNSYIIAPNVLNPSTNAIVYFGFSVPPATPAGNYMQTISFENENVSNGEFNAISTSNSVTITANVVGTCYISLSPNSIDFGALSPTANVPTNFGVNDIDNGGNVAASLLVYGGDWTGPATFGISNTTWNATSGTPFSTASHLTGTAATTGISIPAPTPSDTATSNSIYFGLGIPPGTPAGTYTQIITIENSC